MDLDTLLDNTDKSSKHIVMCDQQMHQITPQIYTECYKVSHPIYVLLVDVVRVPNLSHIYSKASHETFWDKCTKWPQNNIEH